MLQIGDKLTLKGKTVKGKNRINRSGSQVFEIGKFSWSGDDILVRSIKNQSWEMFWMHNPDKPGTDPNMEIVQDAKN